MVRPGSSTDMPCGCNSTEGLLELFPRRSWLAAALPAEVRLLTRFEPLPTEGRHWHLALARVEQRAPLESVFPQALDIAFALVIFMPFAVRACKLQRVHRTPCGQN